MAHSHMPDGFYDLVCYLFRLLHDCTFRDFLIISYKRSLLALKSLARQQYALDI
jgi:hypothetical protein